MRFWDTSALIPLFVAERATAQVERRLREDPEVIVWTLLEFVTLDRNLAVAAEREGFHVLGP